MRRGAYLAANNRAQKVVQQYQNTRFVEEALAIMAQSYQHINQPQLAEDTRRILAQNFPNSPYLTCLESRHHALVALLEIKRRR